MHTSRAQRQRLGPVRPRNDEVLDADSKRRGHGRQYAPHRAHGSVELKLAESEDIRTRIGDYPGPTEYRERNWKIVSGAFLLESGREEIDENMIHGKFETGVSRSDSDSLPRFANGTFREAHQIYRRDSSPNIDFNRDQFPVEPHRFMRMNSHDDSGMPKGEANASIRSEGSGSEERLAPGVQSRLLRTIMTTKAVDMKR